MNIRLRSQELRKYFGTDVLTDLIAEKRKNNMSFELTGPVTQELLEDLENIRRHHQTLLRHLTISNASSSAQDLQPIIDILSGYNSRDRNDSIKEIKIISPFESDFDVDFSRIRKIKQLYFDKRGTVGKLRIDPKKMPTRPDDGRLALLVSGVDISELDLTGTLIKDLRVIGKDVRGFSGVKGLKQITNLSIVNRPYDREFLDMIDFINSPDNGLISVFMNGADFGSSAPFQTITNTDIPKISIINSKVRDLSGLERFQGLLTYLNIKGNNLDASAVETLQRFAAAYPELELVVTGGNPDLTNRFLNATKNGLTQVTIDNILRSYGASDGPKVINMNDALYRLMEDPTIPISIRDAERIRALGGVVNNPIEFDKDLDLDSFDFEKDYLKGGTLLLTKDQIEHLLKIGKKIPMKLAVQIKDVSEISRDDISRYKNQANVDEVRVITDDGFTCTNAPYTANEYYYIRGVLDEIVAGIDPNEPDVDKVATIYERIIRTIAYDHSCIDRNSREGVRHGSKEVHSCRNLLNGLTTETCVCAGYADILRQALNLVGIESKYLYGECFGDPDTYAGHAWVAIRLKDENGVYRYYLSDPTWDRNNDYRYFLMDGDTFTKNGHRVYESTDVPEFAPKEFDPEKKKVAIAKAKARYVNPRKEFLERYRRERDEAAKKAQAAREKKKQEEKPKEKKPEEKKPEEKKPEEKKPEEKKPEKKKEEFVPSDELKAKMEKADSVRREMDLIYKRLESTLGLTNKGEYYRKLAELEEKYKKLQEDINTQKEQELLAFTKKEEEPAKRSAKPEEKKTEGQSNEEVEQEKKRITDRITVLREKRKIAEENLSDRKLQEFLEGEYVEDRVSGPMKEFFEKQTGRKFDDDLYEFDWSGFESEEDFQGTPFRVIAKTPEQIDAEIVLLEKQLSELEAKKEEPREKKPEEKKPEEKKPEEKKPEEKKPEEKKPEEKKTEEKKPEEKKPEEKKPAEVLEIVTKKSEEEIVKGKEETDEIIKKEEELKQAVKHNATLKNTDVPVIKTREDLIAAKKNSRVASLEQGYVNIINRVFKRDISKPPRIIRGIIKYGVAARFKIQDGIRKVFNLKDPYQEEIDAINSGSPVTAEKEDFFRKTKLDLGRAKDSASRSESRKRDIDDIQK